MTDTELREKAELWAVSIAGPDDLVPVASYDAACSLANSFNAWWQQHIASRGGLHEFDPRMWATPVVYAWDAESHARGVANPSEDYAPFLSALSVAGTNSRDAEPVAWTQPSVLAHLAEDQDASGSVWNKRDMFEARGWLEDPDLPDDVPLFTRPSDSEVALREAAEPFATWAKDNVEIVPGEFDDDGLLLPAHYQWTGPMSRTRIVDWFGPSEFGRLMAALGQKGE